MTDEAAVVASDTKVFPLPDLGEGLTEGEVLRWLVSEGDTVEVNQPIVEIETAKAAVELPCPYVRRTLASATTAKPEWRSTWPASTAVTSSRGLPTSNG